jgi:hypothetical protein
VNLNPAAAVRLGGILHRLIDDLHARPDRNVIKQVFDVVITQADAALADAQPNAKLALVPWIAYSLPM